MIDKRELLTQMWLAGEKLEVIATTLGMSVDATKKMRKRLNLPPRERKAA